MRYMQATPNAPADVIHAQLTDLVRDIRAGERLRMKRES
jgi:hypothetical protein